MSDYVMKKSLKIDNKNIGVYFADNTKPPLFVLTDVTRFLFGDYNKSTKDIVRLISEGHSTKIRTSAGYEIVVCDLQGLREVFEACCEESKTSEFMKKVVDFVDTQYRTLPGPIKRTKIIQEISSKDYFLMITALDNHSVRFVRIGDTRWFAAQDILRGLVGIPAERIEEAISDLDSEDICDVKFQNDEVRRCISETGVLQVLARIIPDRSLNLGNQLISVCNAIENKNINGLKAIVSNLIIDGRETDVMRYAVFNFKQVKTVVFRYDKDTILFFFSVNDIAKILGANITNSNRKAMHKNLMFVSDDNNIFLDNSALREIFSSYKDYPTLYEDITKSIKENSIMNQVMAITDTSSPIVSMTREEFEEIRKDTPMFTKGFEPIVTEDGFSIIDYYFIDVSGESCLICLATYGDDEEVFPMIWSKNLGVLSKISYMPTLINRVFKPSEYTKVNLPDAKRTSVKLVRVRNLKKILGYSKISDKAKDDLFKAVTEAVQAIMDKHNGVKETKGETIVGETKIQEEAKVEEAIVEEEEHKEKDINEEPKLARAEDVISFRGKPVKISIFAEPEKGILVYYDYEQLCQSLEIDPSKLGEFKKYGDVEGKESLISILDIANAIKDLVEEPNVIVQQLFVESKEAITDMAHEMGLEVKNSEENKGKTSDNNEPLFSTKDGKAYTFGAIILAEKFRNIIAIAEIVKKIPTDGLPGPSNRKLINDLWKYIDCQAPDQQASFAFQKQVIAVNERYQRMLELLQD